VRKIEQGPHFSFGYFVQWMIVETLFDIAYKNTK
jgi:hypothetical protein